jgi:hypothetical protein
MLRNQWSVAEFYPIEYIPSGVRLTAYGGDATGFPTDVLQAYLDAVAAGRSPSRSTARTRSTRPHKRTPTWNTDGQPANSSSSRDDQPR